jgi:hypothetical protein
MRSVAVSVDSDACISRVLEEVVVATEGMVKVSEEGCGVMAALFSSGESQSS